MVAAQNEEVLGILDLVGQEQADGFQRLLSTVDVVTKEEVVRLGREATVLEQTQQVIVLAVDVAANLLGREGGVSNAPDGTWRKTNCESSDKIRACIP